MAITMTSREFNQHASRALALSQQEPVFITKWGKVVSVIESFQDYRQKQKQETLAEAFLTPDLAADIDDFDEILTEIRQSSQLRVTELE